MKKSFTVKTLVLFSVLSLFLTGCCMFGKPPCIGCGDKKWGHREFKGEECPFEGCLKKAPCCILKNKEKLSLTEDQISRIKAASEKREKTVIQLKADSEKVALDVKAKFMEEDFDAAGINSLIDKKFELKKQLIKSFVNSHAEVLSTLTPEQRTKFKEIMKGCKKKGCCSKDKCCDQD